MRRALIVAIALLAVGPAAGEDARDYDGIAKATTCHAWTQMRGEVRDGARTKLQAWLTRTVIGDWNAPRMPGNDAGLDYAGIFGMADVLCATYPRKTLKDAARMLIEDMDSR